MLWRKAIYGMVVRCMTEEIRITLKNRYSALDEEDNPSVEAMNDRLKRSITECAVDGVGKIGRQDTGKLCQGTIYPIKKCQCFKASNPTYSIALAEVSKLTSVRWPT